MRRTEGIMQQGSTLRRMNQRRAAMKIQELRTSRKAVATSNPLHPLFSSFLAKAFLRDWQDNSADGQGDNLEADEGATREDTQEVRSEDGQEASPELRGRTCHFMSEIHFRSGRVRFSRCGSTYSEVVLFHFGSGIGRATRPATSPLQDRCPGCNGVKLSQREKFFRERGAG